jgi:hypothetical protein
LKDGSTVLFSVDHDAIVRRVPRSTMAPATLFTGRRTGDRFDPPGSANAPQAGLVIRVPIPNSLQESASCHRRMAAASIRR